LVNSNAAKKSQIIIGSKKGRLTVLRSSTSCFVVYELKQQVAGAIVFSTPSSSIAVVHIN